MSSLLLWFSDFFQMIFFFQFLGNGVTRTQRAFMIMMTRAVLRIVWIQVIIRDCILEILNLDFFKL